MNKQKYFKLIEKYEAAKDFDGLCAVMQNFGPQLEYAVKHSSIAECNNCAEVHNRLTDAVNSFIIDFNKRTGQNLPLGKKVKPFVSARSAPVFYEPSRSIYQPFPSDFPRRKVSIAEPVYKPCGSGKLVQEGMHRYIESSGGSRISIMDYDTYSGTAKDYDGNTYKVEGGGIEYR